MTSFSRDERHRLCDLALDLGPDAPTLCGDWTTKDLVVHLLVRERSVLGAPGILLPPLSGLTDRVSEHIGRGDLPLLVDQLRRPRLTWAAVPALDRLANTVEFFVHHEDLRRAQPGWTPRPLPDDRQDALWRSLGALGRGLVRSTAMPAGTAVVAEDVRTGERRTLRRGGAATAPVTLRGLPAELVLHLFGRSETVDVELAGPEQGVRALAADRLGL